MTIEGTVVNGAIVLDEGIQLPEGTRITVVPATADPRDQPTLHSLVEMAGAFDDLPADFAAEHDHYLHGAPRQTLEKG